MIADGAERTVSKLVKTPSGTHSGQMPSMSWKDVGHPFNLLKKRLFFVTISN
jgi:hypothetical protein